MIDNTFSISMYNIAEQFCLSQNINIAELGLNDIINIIKDKIFNFDYTIPATSSEEEHKNNIEKLFINKYMFNDFGCYSFGEWRLYFQQAFNEMIENKLIFGDFGKSCGSLFTVIVKPRKTTKNDIVLFSAYLRGRFDASINVIRQSLGGLFKKLIKGHG